MAIKSTVNMVISPSTSMMGQVSQKKQPGGGGKAFVAGAQGQGCEQGRRQHAQRATAEGRCAAASSRGHDPAQTAKHVPRKHGGKAHGGGVYAQHGEAAELEEQGLQGKGPPEWRGWPPSPG